MLFSAHILWYYITLSLHHFQRLPFLLIKLNSMLRTFRACFWTCLTLLLWSNIHSYTHLFSFPNLAISCGCPALSIWVYVVIYASHLSDASSHWVMLPLSVSPLQFFSPSQMVSRRWCHPPFPPPRDDTGCYCRLRCDASLQSSWVGWAESSCPMIFDPLLGWYEWAQTSGHDTLSLSAFPQGGC